MKPSPTTRLHLKFAGLVVAASVFACNSDESDSDAGTGGTPGSNTAVGGGSGAPVGGSGPTATTGGVGNLGGSEAVTPGVGGQSTGGGQTGGTSGTSGTTGGTSGTTGGTSGTTGGFSGTGGTTLATGGQPSTGGVFGTGGNGNTGGQGATGGTSTTGGTGGGQDATGGTSTTGGTGGGQDATGGTSTTGGTGGGGVFPDGVTTPRIMIVGDSISAGPGCYKKFLVQNLEDGGYSQFEFVGEYDDDCGGGVRHSAVSCTTSENYTQSTFTVSNCFPGETFAGMSTLVATHTPDLVMLQLGVNDVWSGSAPIEPILQNYGELIEQARAHNPNIVVVVAQIHRIITDNCANAASTTNAEQLVNAVPGWAQGVSTEASPVFVADLWTNSDAHESDDCVHPNDAGAQRMGSNWYDALKDLLPRD